MPTKNKNKYLDKAFDEEEVFVLLGRDGSAPFVVIEWIKQNIELETPEKLHEALDVAIKMIKGYGKIRIKIAKQEPIVTNDKPYKNKKSEQKTLL